MGGKRHAKCNVFPKSILFFFTCFSISFKMQISLEEMAHYYKIPVRFKRLTYNTFMLIISVGKGLELRALTV